jgi:hypothetical protein
VLNKTSPIQALHLSLISRTCTACVIFIALSACGQSASEDGKSSDNPDLTEKIANSSAQLDILFYRRADNMFATGTHYKVALDVTGGISLSTLAPESFAGVLSDGTTIAPSRTSEALHGIEPCQAEQKIAAGQQAYCIASFAVETDLSLTGVSVVSASPGVDAALPSEFDNQKFGCVNGCSSCDSMGDEDGLSCDDMCNSCNSGMMAVDWWGGKCPQAREIDMCGPGFNVCMSTCEQSQAASCIEGGQFNVGSWSAEFDCEAACTMRVEKGCVHIPQKPSCDASDCQDCYVSLYAWASCNSLAAQN